MKYRVTVPFAVYVTVEVEADNKEDAEQVGIKEAHLIGYRGSWGTNRLVGVNTGSVVHSDEPIEDSGFPVYVEEAE